MSEQGRAYTFDRHVSIHAPREGERLEEITSGVHGFTERAFEDWAPVQLIATADKPLELLWANEYSVFLPQTLAIVSRADLDAHNAEMERLQAEVEALQQEREPAPPTMRERLDDCNAEVARLQALPVWEPVALAIDTCPEWECACGGDRCRGSRRILYVKSDDVIGIWSDGGAINVTVVLPDDIRLCRLVSQEA